MVIFHSYVNVYQRVIRTVLHWQPSYKLDIVGLYAPSPTAINSTYHTCKPT